MEDSDSDNDWNWMESLDPIQQHWAEENKTFVPTKASAFISEKLLTHDRIIITGSAGSGKSAIAQHIALKYAMENKRISYINALDEIEERIPNMAGTDIDIFVIDDPIGKYRFDPLAFRWWRRQRKQLKYFLRRGRKREKVAEDIRVLLTCRSDLIDDDSSLFFKDYTMINIDEDSLALTNDEKENILKSHISVSDLGENDIKLISESTKAFPTICQTVGCNENFQANINTFFQNPSELIRKEVLHLKENAKEKYLALFLIVIFNNSFVQDDFLLDCQENVVNDDENDDDDNGRLADINKGILTDMMTKFGFSETTSARSILSSMETLNGPFLKNIDGTFQFQNSLLFQTCVHLFCTEVYDIFLEYCDSSFFRKYVKTDLQNKGNLFVDIYLEDNFIGGFVKRIASDIYDGTFLDVFLCPWTNDERVIMAMEKILITKTTKDIMELTVNQALSKEDSGLKPYSKKERIVLRGFSKLDFIIYGDKISPIVLSLIFNHNRIFSAMFDKLKLDQISSSCLKKEPLLSAACANGNKHLVGKILEFYGKALPNVMWNDNEKIHAFHIAANFHHVDVMEMFLAKKQDVNITTTLNESPLFLALSVEMWYVKTSKQTDEERKQDGLLETLSLLIKNGANVNTHSENREHPLTLACSKVNIKATQLLLEHGADVNKVGISKIGGLHFAAMHGHADLVNLLLEKGADINLRTSKNQTALYFAARKGHPAIVEILLSRGADKELKTHTWNSPFFVACRYGHEKVVNLLLKFFSEDVKKSDRDECPPLHAAIESGKVEIVNLLLENGAKANAREERSMKSPLYLAAGLGKLSIVKLLLQKGVSIDIQTKDGCTPLIKTCKNGFCLVAQCLLANGANVDICDKRKWTPLLYASKYGHLDIVKLLLESKADMSLSTGNGEDPLYIASSWGHEEIVKELLKRKANGNTLSTGLRTPLSVAVKKGHKKVLEVLLLNGANVNQRVDHNDTSLIIAARENLLDIVNILLKNGADITLSDCEMENALHNACQTASNDVIETLLDAGLDINGPQCEGYSVLHLALMNHNRQAALCLLEHNSDVNMISNGKTPISLACETGYYDVVEALLNKNVEVNPENDSRPLTPDPLSIAAGNGSLQIAQTLIRSKAIVNSRNSEGETPLFQATKQGHCRLMKLLIDNEARVNIQDKYGKTCLHLSVCKHKSDDMVLLLLKNNAAVNVCTKDGITALMMAIAGKQGVSEKRIRSIIEHGANVNAQDTFGKTALHRAAELGLGSVIETLLNNDANVNTCNQDGESALFIATKSGHANVVQLLLQNNAEVKVLSNSGESPFDIANRMEFHNISKLLQESAAIKADRGDSPKLDSKEDSITSKERKLVLVKCNPLGPALPRKRSPYKIPVRR